MSNNRNLGNLANRLDEGSTGEVLTKQADGSTQFAAAGGGADLYAENYDGTSTLPSATGTNALALQDGAVASANRSIAVGRDAVSSGNYAVALGVYTDAINSFGTALGYKAQTASNDYATALTNSRASGSNSFAAAIANNSSSYGATGANSIAMGSQAKASNSDSVAIGDTNIASGVSSFASGKQTEASAIYARSGGYLSVANVSGDAWASGNFATAGDAQNVKLVIRGATSNTTPVILTTGGGAASGSRSLILETNSAYAFSLMVVARRDASDGTESAAVKIEGLIRKESNDASITLVNSNKTTISNAPSWTVSVSATVGETGEDNGGLDVVCADFVNGHNIHWVGTLKYTKVTYA